MEFVLTKEYKESKVTRVESDSVEWPVVVLKTPDQNARILFDPFGHILVD
jgi:hypothetical protein